MIYLLDTNVVSDFLKRYPPVTEQIYAGLARGDRLVVVSPVHYELIRSLVKNQGQYSLLVSTSKSCPYLSGKHSPTPTGSRRRSSGRTPPGAASS